MSDCYGNERSDAAQVTSRRHFLKKSLAGLASAGLAATAKPTEDRLSAIRSVRGSRPAPDPEREIAFGYAYRALQRGRNFRRSLEIDGAPTAQHLREILRTIPGDELKVTAGPISIACYTQWGDNCFLMLPEEFASDRSEVQNLAWAYIKHQIRKAPLFAMPQGVNWSERPHREMIAADSRRTKLVEFVTLAFLIGLGGCAHSFSGD